MSRDQDYETLVMKRKACHLCHGLANPAETDLREFDSEEIGPWSRWQGSLHADLMIVGQDWGDINYFRKWKGADEPSGNPTNENLRKILDSIGIEVGTPGSPAPQSRVFLTNLILCLKSSGLQASVENAWLRTCAEQFLKGLVNLLKPRVLVILGHRPAQAGLMAFGVRVKKGLTLQALMEQGPYPIREGTSLFPVYHCGKRGVNMNRPLEAQVKDWIAIREELACGPEGGR